MDIACTFFGHHDCPSTIKPKITDVLIDLIENHAVEWFYVGNTGTYDRLVRSALRELAKEYPHIHYAVVLDRLPVKKSDDHLANYSDTILPEGIENGPPRYAIVRRNRWMFQQADYVVTYITRSFGGAAQFAEMAERQKKTVINLAELSLRNHSLRL